MITLADLKRINNERLHVLSEDESPCAAWDIDQEGFGKWTYIVARASLDEALEKGYHMGIMLESAIALGFFTGYLARIEQEGGPLTNMETTK